MQSKHTLNHPPPPTPAPPPFILVRLPPSPSKTDTATRDAFHFTPHSFTMASSGKTAVPTFSLDASRFDQSTFEGRWSHFLQVTNPLNLFISSSELDSAVALLDAYKAGEVPAGTTDAELWDARRVKEAILHPDTGQPIPIAFRMSSFVWANVPICTLLLWPNASTALTILGQTVNQVYNVGTNYANRNASSEQSIGDIATGFVGATSVALAVALAGRSFMGKYGASLPPLVARLVPYTAVAASGVAGMVIMRFKELTDGVMLLDQHGDEHGLSQTAGRLAIFKTALSRAVFFPIFPMVLPPVIVETAAKFFPAIKSNPRVGIPTEVAAIAACMLTALPAAIAMFPQHGEVEASSLEPRFQSKLDRNGQPITTFTFNKGL